MPVTPIVQFAAMFGIYGLSLLTLLVAAMPAVLAGPARSGVRWTGASLVLLALIALWGWIRVPTGPDPIFPGIHLRLVQANIPQAEIYRGDNQVGEIRRYLELSHRPGFDSLTAVIWPEAAVPFLLDQDAEGRRVVALGAPPAGVLVTGTPRADIAAGSLKTLWNSLEVLAPDGSVLATYDKAHLVPFGEYVPWRQYLPISIAKVTAGSTDFTPGPGLRVLEVKGLPPFEPLICYEAIFPGDVVAKHAHPDWLLNITDDAWFGISAGPYQHFASARLRAVEEGVALARDGNDGVTAMVDPFGRITGMLALGDRGVLDSDLPRPIAGRTVFARLGNFAPLSLIAAFLLVAMVSRRFR
jgi:apolipoprotein N-acyltransferase